MLLAKEGTSFVEFGMKPHVDRCYGQMAMALGLDYWLVPQVSAFYNLNYEMTEDKAAAVIRLLSHLLAAKSLPRKDEL